MSDATSPRRLTFDPTVNLGALLQISAVAVGIVMFVARGEKDIALMSQEVQNLRTTMAENVGRLTTATNDLRTAMAPLGSMAARLDGIERRLVALENTAASRDDRLTNLNEYVAALRAQVNSLDRRPDNQR